MTTCEEYVLAELEKYKKENNSLKDCIIEMNKQIRQKDIVIKKFESTVLLNETDNKHGG